MIVVLADDITGAAELAGIGLRYELKAEIIMSASQHADVDLLVVCTDSRSLNNEDAEKVTVKALQEILSLKPELIYKKIDSVLRGHILDEVKVQMKLTGLNKAVILAANPSLGRTIKDGKYYIDGVLIHKTGFATDPEFAITDSDVLKMIGATDNDEIKTLRHVDKLPQNGIVIGEAETTADMNAWAGRVNNNWVLVGAGDFFISLLHKRFSVREGNKANIELPHLFVSGTAFDKSKQFIKSVKEKNECVAYLPLFTRENDEFNDESWLNQVSRIINKQNRVIIAISNEENRFEGVSALHLRSFMAKAIKRILQREKIKELFIEGGSTAGAILQEMKITSLEPKNELQRGVVRMKVKDMYITMKPGSYELPGQIKDLYLMK
ncbi:MAG TPA: four-carbon acid sugar kinase family protein [Chitinophagaceae bacterium]|jgi:uncharacterized protein YgbK (DUF1537 family)|nr:four-carbon acid sugar kinase family protein [Chitinophagaceae bacterium]